MILLDASALLAFVHDEEGADEVEAALDSGAVCSAANWSEVAQVVIARVGSFDTVRALLLSYDLVVEPVTSADAESAAALWRRESGLSLGDRICLALSARLVVDVLTADRAWGDGPGIRQLR